MIAIYARQSLDKKDSISIETQIDCCKKEITVGEIKTYIDKGFSGKDVNRPKFKEMERDIREGLITKVIVYKLDRISRNILNFANIIEFYKKYNVSFISCNEKFDTDSPIGMAMISICMVFAQLERETIQKRVKDNYYARGAKGMYMGGRAPYGFIKIETRLEGKKTYTFENDNKKVLHLLDMYELYSTTDMSLGKVSDYLNSKGILAAEGGAWDSGKISRILRSPIYVKGNADIYSYYKNKGSIITNDISDFVGINGCYLYGKRESNERKYTDVKDHTLSIALHEGVVDADTWLSCQYKLDKNKQIKNSGKGKYTWLSGIMKCGICGYSVSVVTSRDKKYLSCRGKSNYKVCDGFSKPMFVEDLESIISDAIFKQVEISRNTNLPETKIKDSKQNKANLQILDIEEQIENLMNQLTKASALTMTYIDRKIASLDSEKNLLITEIKKDVIIKSKTHSKEEIFDKVDKWDTISIEEKKEVCTFFISRVKVKIDEIEIDWNTIN